MKKILLVFTIFFTLAVSACQSTQNPSSQSTQNPSNGGEIPLLTIGNYQEYCDYVNSGTIPKRMEFWFNPQTYPKVSSLPDCFIPYEKFSMLGEFKLFVFSSEIRVGDFSSYSYTFRDDNGFEYSLYIDHNKKTRQKLPLSFLTHKQTRLLIYALLRNHRQAVCKSKTSLTITCQQPADSTLYHGQKTE